MQADPTMADMTPELQNVYKVCQEVRELHPAKPTTLRCVIVNPAFLSTMDYTLPKDAGFVKFRYITDREVHVTVWPEEVFHAKVLPRSPAILKSRYLDPPTNTIPRSPLFRLLHDNTTTVYSIQFTIDGRADVVSHGVRFLLTRLMSGE
jgi:hypothetical protein